MRLLLCDGELDGDAAATAAAACWAVSICGERGVGGAMLLVLPPAKLLNRPAGGTRGNVEPR